MELQTERLILRMEI